MPENHTPQTIKELFLNSKKKMQEHKTQFLSIFNIDLERFMGAFGFDVVKFDVWLQTPDNVSTKQYIQSKYGDEAAELILKLIKF